VSLAPEGELHNCGGERFLGLKIEKPD